MESQTSLLHIGCAGWSLPATFADQFPASGTHLERYGARFSAVEINSSFYRPHRPQTYTRWAATVPESFQFAVKIPKSITHERRLKDIDELLGQFLNEVFCLGLKLGPILVQLPPSLAFEPVVVGAFFRRLREEVTGTVVCEPRHLSWFNPRVNGFLQDFEIARVAADPALVPEAKLPSGWDGLQYYRLHGSPQVYYSAYSPQFLEELAQSIQEAIANKIPVWCIFDNTAEGAATGDALDLMSRLE